MCTSHPASRPRGGRPRLAAIALGCAALVAGCAVGPDFIAPARPAVDAYVPDGAARTRFAASDATQTLAPDAPFPDAWWRLFGSREIDAAVDDAFAGSPTLARARATLARSEHALITGAGVFYPQADAQAGASRQRYVPLRTGANLPASLFNLFTLSTTVSYALDLWGGERRHVEGLAAQADAQRHALAAARLTLAANVVNTMIARAAYADEIALTRELIALTDEQIRLTRAQVSAGTSAYTAVLALQAARASLDASLPALEQKTGEADDLLATLAGRYPAEHVPPQVSLAAIALPARLPRTVPSELVRRRPDILQAEAVLHAASANIGVASAALFPSVTLSASGGFDATRASALFGPAGRAWSVGASITAPLFHGGALWYQRKAAVDAFDESNAAYRQTVLSAFAQVADTLRALDHDATALDAQARAMRGGSRRSSTRRARPAICRCCSPISNIGRRGSRGCRRARSGCRTRSRCTRRSAAGGAARGNPDAARRGRPPRRRSAPRRFLACRVALREQPPQHGRRAFLDHQEPRQCEQRRVAPDLARLEREARDVAGFARGRAEFAVERAERPGEQIDLVADLARDACVRLRELRARRLAKRAGRRPVRGVQIGMPPRVRLHVEPAGLVQHAQLVPRERAGRLADRGRIDEQRDRHPLAQRDRAGPVEDRCVPFVDRQRDRLRRQRDGLAAQPADHVAQRDEPVAEPAQVRELRFECRDADRHRIGAADVRETVIDEHGDVGRRRGDGGRAARRSGSDDPRDGPKAGAENGRAPGEPGTK